MIRPDRGQPHLALAYLVFFTPRSGSYLLCSELGGSRVAGRPAELFGPTHTHDDGGGRSAIQYLADVIERAATPNGVFGAKVTRFHFEAFSARLRGELGGRDVDLVDGLAAVAADTRVVWLRRRDKDRQAISYWRALATGEWSLPPGQTAAPIDPQEFDYERIEQLLRRTADDEQWIETYLNRRGIGHLDLWYEDLAADPQSARGTVLAYLDLSGGALEARPPRFARQADSVSDVLLHRFKIMKTAHAKTDGAHAQMPTRRR